MLEQMVFTSANFQQIQLRHSQHHPAEFQLTNLQASSSSQICWKCWDAGTDGFYFSKFSANSAKTFPAPSSRISAYQSVGVYKKILISQAVQDISIGVMYCLTLSCGINRHMLMIPPGPKLPIILIQNSLSEGLATSRFSLFCVALADRHIANCKPSTYHGHFIRQHFEKLLMLSFFFLLAYKGIFIVIYADAICKDNIAGSRHMSKEICF